MSVDRAERPLRMCVNSWGGLSGGRDIAFCMYIFDGSVYPGLTSMG
jgi:hypothetical protein